MGEGGRGNSHEQRARRRSALSTQMKHVKNAKLNILTISGLSASPLTAITSGRSRAEFGQGYAIQAASIPVLRSSRTWSAECRLGEHINPSHRPQTPEHSLSPPSTISSLSRPPPSLHDLLRRLTMLTKARLLHQASAVSLSLSCAKEESPGTGCQNVPSGTKTH